jgi:hypothetical protein
MFGKDRIDAGNQDYQRELAIALVGSMGFERALRACQDNGWDGMLESVLCYRSSNRSPS